MKKEEYVCPKCGSNNWKVASPFKLSPSMINTPGMVNNLFECVDCGYVGIFFVKDKEKLKKKKVKKSVNKKKVKK